MQQRKFTKRIRPSTQKCHFCETKTLPDYKDVQILAKYTSERGKLLSAVRTGICSKHQRLLTTSIKHARHIGFLPFVVRA